MELGENLNRAASFTGKLFSDVGNLILLIAVNLIPVVNIIFLGYTAKIIREDPEEPPKLSDYGKLFVDGLLVLAAVLVYAIIPAIIIIIGALASMPFYLHAPFVPLFPLQLSALSVIGLVLLFISMIIGVMAVGNMVRTGDFSKIFAFSENWQLIGRVGLANYLVWLFVMFVVFLIAAAVGSLIPWVGGAIFGVFSSIFFGKSLALILNEVKAPS
ncbi:MAG: DUF4013 domain-containing protein [Candidatus Korarchaeota archaeon NZ13-K]|nr:MAG: DUF4013 domain-containing protein [Candidatus Korarchaeota archaeon NZ13-K]